MTSTYLLCNSVFMHMDVCVSHTACVCVWTSDCMRVLFAQPASQINFLWYTIDCSWCYLSLISVVLSSVWTILYVLSLIGAVAQSEVTTLLSQNLYLTQTSPGLYFTPKCNCSDNWKISLIFSQYPVCRISWFFSLLPEPQIKFYNWNWGRLIPL